MKNTVHLIFQQGEITTLGKKKKKFSVPQCAWSHESKGTKCFPSGERGCGSNRRFQTSLNYQSQAGAWGSQKKNSEVQLELTSPSLPSPWSFCTNPVFFSCFQSRASQVALGVKNLPADTRDTGLIPGSEDPLEEGMATHSSILAWRISWIEEPGRLRWQRVRHDRSDLAAAAFSSEDKRGHANSLYHLEFFFF